MSDMAEDVPLAPSRRKRLYEPVILLDALRSVYHKDNRIREADLEAAAGKSPKQIYFCFLNKLSQICDNQPKQRFGKSVTAFVVLDPGTIEYRFACNQRDRNELDTVRDYVTDILNTLGGVTDKQTGDKDFMAGIFSRILLRILAFNRPRIEAYMEALCDKNGRLTFCVESSSKDETAQGKSVSQALSSLQPHIEAARNASSNSNDGFAGHAKALLETIHSHYQPSLEGYMKKKSRGDNPTEDSPWSEVRHALGRLLSYFIAVKVLISALDLWPRLFVDFEVTYIPSSTPNTDPPDIRRNANGIINRMGRKDTMAAYQSYAASLQSHGLDAGIKARVHHTNFQPIVHAEVALLDSVLRDQAAAEIEGDDPLRFFNEADFGGYISTSKPTCLLCSFYFAAHPSGVQCRPSHGNLYCNWRPPSVSLSDGEEALQERDAILEAMIKDVRGETVRAIKQRSSTRRKHDSRDTPSDPWRSTAKGGSSVASVRAESGDAEDLAEMMGQINLDIASSRSSAGPSRGSGQQRRVAQARLRPIIHDLDSGDEIAGEDNDGGGARV